MKTLYLSAAVLALLFLSALGSSTLLNARCDTWHRQLHAAEEAAAAGQWQATEEQLQDLRRSWEKAAPTLHCLLHREVPDEVSLLLDQCRLFSVLEDEEELLLAAQQLHCQYRHIAETEELRFVNIF